MNETVGNYILIAYIIGALTSEGKINLCDDSIVNVTEHIVNQFNSNRTDYDFIEEYAQDYLIQNYGLVNSMVNVTDYENYLN